MKLSHCKRFYLYFLWLVTASALTASASEQKIIWGSDALAAVMPMDPALSPIQSNRGLSLTLPRSTARPGERFLDAVVAIEGTPQLAGLSWKATLYSSANSDPIARSTQPVTSPRATFRFDVRDTLAGIVEIAVVENGKTLLTVADTFSRVPDTPLSSYGTIEIPLNRAGPNVATKKETSWVTFGLPLPAGALWDAAELQLKDGNGAAVFAQFLPVAQWSEAGSLKWLRVDAFVPEGTDKLFVHTSKKKSDPTSPPTLKVKPSANAIEVDTGTATYRVEPNGAILNQITRNGKSISELSGTGRGLYVIDQKGRIGEVSEPDTTVQIEFQGEQVLRLRVNGMYRTTGNDATPGEELARFTAWFDFAAGQPDCRIHHHFIVTRNTNEVWFTAIGWDFDLKGWQASEGLFATLRDEPTALESLALGPEGKQMAQIQHRRYQGGSDQYILGSPHDPASLRSGEMGDWAAAVSKDRGLWIACHESARQHPKSFRVTPSQLSIDLFYPEAGEALDFRAPALVERWNEGNLLSDELVATTSALSTNAIGWSKTHILRIEPTSGPEAKKELVRAGNDFTHPIQALPDPNWTYQTRVAGPLYPRNVDRFPQIETFIDEAFAYWESEQEFFGEYGFVDYYTGPHHTRQFPQSQGRFRASYTLRNAFWLLYLRSGERKFRDMASETNRSYLDSYIASWDGPSRIRGLYLHSVGPQDPYASLPFYWEGFTRASLGSHTNLDQFLLDYYITGNPRAKDGVLDYAAGVQRWWQQSQNDWRIIAVLRAINSAYSFTWDPDLRLIQENLLGSLYDPRSPVYLTYEGRPYSSSTYKTQEDLSALIEGWELYGTQRYWNIATAVSRYWWLSSTPGARFEAGRSGAFLWDTENDRSIAQHLWLLARHEVTLSPESTSAAAELRFQGMPYALHSIAESKADEQPAAHWAGVEILSGHAGIVLGKKDRNQPIRATLLFERSGFRDLPEIQELSTVSRIGQRLVQLDAGFGDGMTLRIPPEAETADFYVPVPEYGIHHTILDDRSPLLLYADGWWKPSPETMNPPATIYFSRPKDSESAYIHFEKLTRLKAPDGSIWPEGKPVRGKIALPAEPAGVWSFSSDTGGAVRAGGMPPLFSFDTPDSLGTQRPVVPTLPQPVSFGDWDGLEIPEGETLEFTTSEIPLPFREGTIEFYFKPDWNSLDLQTRTVKRLLQLPTEKGRPWHMIYVVDANRGGWPGHPWSRSHVLEMEIESKGSHRRPRTLCIRKTIFEQDEWSHVAIVWGERMFGYTADRTEMAFDVKIFVDGKEGRYAAWPRQGNQAAHPPKALIFGPGLDGQISDLRVSEHQRYTEDFIPPQPAQIQSDRRTLYLNDLRPAAQGNKDDPDS